MTPESRYHAFIEFRETSYADPIKWFELCIGNIPVEIFYPTQEVLDHVSSNDIRFYPSNTCEVEAESNLQITEKLITEFTCLGFDRGRTRLEVACAIAAIQKRFREKLQSHKLI